MIHISGLVLILCYSHSSLYRSFLTVPCRLPNTYILSSFEPSATTTNYNMAASGFTFYNYDPSIAAACIFALIFGVSALLHTWQCWRARAWYCIPFIVGALCKCFYRCPLNCGTFYTDCEATGSRDRWIHRTGHVCAGSAKLYEESVHHPIGAAAARTSAVCSDSLHGSRSPHDHPGSWASFVGPRLAANQNLCCWRCAVISSAERRRRYVGYRKNGRCGKERREYHCRRLGDSNHLLWTLHCRYRGISSTNFQQSYLDVPSRQPTVEEAAHDHLCSQLLDNDPFAIPRRRVRHWKGWRASAARVLDLHL